MGNCHTAALLCVVCFSSLACLPAVIVSSGLNFSTFVSSARIYKYIYIYIYIDLSLRLAMFVRLFIQLLFTLAVLP